MKKNSFSRFQKIEKRNSGKIICNFKNQRICKQYSSITRRDTKEASRLQVWVLLQNLSNFYTNKNGFVS